MTVQTASGSHVMYVNTMVFSIIAAVLSVAMLLTLVYVPSSRVFVYGVAVVELGLISVIVYALVSIFAYEKSISSSTANSAVTVVVDTCPDYFANSLIPSASSPSSASSASTLTNGGTSSAFSASTPAQKNSPSTAPTGVICANGYSSPEGDKMFYFARKGCTSMNLSDPACSIDPSVTSGSPAVAYNVQLNKYSNTSATSICGVVNTTDATTPFFSVPWTDVKARCNSMSLVGVN